MSNKKIGNDFEKELCEVLAEYGFWVHNFTQNQDGQPADIIAVKYALQEKVLTSLVWRKIKTSLWNYGKCVVTARDGLRLRLRVRFI